MISYAIKKNHHKRLHAGRISPSLIMREAHVIVMGRILTTVSPLPYTVSQDDTQDFGHVPPNLFLLLLYRLMPVYEG